MAKPRAEKDRTTVRGIFRRYGRTITFRKPNGHIVQFFNQPLIQRKRAQPTTTDRDSLPHWVPRRTQTRLLDHCAICGSSDTLELHHVRHIRKRGATLRGFSLYLAAISRRRLPVCHPCHRAIHAGKYDGASLAAIMERRQAPETDSTGASEGGPS